MTKIGSPEANLPQDIQLVGSHILAEHCTFKNTDGVVTLEPSPDAPCYVNGRKVSNNFSLFFYKNYLKFWINKLNVFFCSNGHKGPANTN